MKAAVIGAGHIAKQHLGALGEVPGARVVGVCDLSPSTAEAMAERYGCAAWYTDHRTMLAEARPDVVHICTPPGTHARLAAEAISAGAHVLIEKPAAAKLEELTPLLEAATGSGRLLAENYNYVYNRQSLAISELIRSGEFGEVVHVDVMMALDILGPSNPFCDPNIPNALRGQRGGAIGDLLPHLVSLAHEWAGPVRRCRAIWRKRSGAHILNSDEFLSVSECERATASLSFTAHSQPDLFWVRVHGTKMRASASLFETYFSVERVRGGAKPLMPVRNGLDEAKAARRGAIGGLWRKLGGGPASYEGLWELVRRFYSAAAGRGDTPVSLSKIVEVNRWSDMLKQQDDTCGC